MTEQPEQDEAKGWGAFLTRAIRASVAGGAERESIWSVSRPLIRLYLMLFSVQSGWLFWRTFRNTTAEHPGSGWEFVALETLGGVSSHGLGVAMSSLIVVEGVSALMVMYNLGMNLIVRPIIKWHERRGEARGEERGIAIGEERGEERGIAIGEERGEERGIAIGEERGEERGIAIGEERADAGWRAWYQRSVDAAKRGEPFDELPPPPPHQNGEDKDC